MYIKWASLSLKYMSWCLLSMDRLYKTCSGPSFYGRIVKDIQSLEHLLRLLLFMEDLLRGLVSVETMSMGLLLIGFMSLDDP